MVSHHALHQPLHASSLHLPPTTASVATAPATRAASVTSGRSHTRRHRHARSHNGGSSSNHLPQNEFPVFFHTGDVEIVLATPSGKREQRYLLHRLILSQCSGFFEAGTRDAWSRGRIEAGNGLSRIEEDGGSQVGAGSSRTSSMDGRSSHEQGGKRKWRYALDWRGADPDETPMLVQKDSSPASLFGDGQSDRPPVRNKPPTSSENFFRSVTNFSALSLNDRPQATAAPSESGDEVLKDYDNLLRTMYQYPPILDTLNIATAYTECKALLHLADMYDALDIVGTRVDHHLLRFGARLFKQIAKYPPSYLKLGYLARSRTIFTEAMIHVVGQWPLASPQLRNGQIDEIVMDLIEDKVEDLDEMKQRVESKLWRLTLTTSRGERITPSNDYLSWLAMSLFRQWVAENTTPAPTPILKDTSRPGNGSSTAAAGGSHRISSRASSSTNNIASQRAPSAAAPPPPPPPPQQQPPLNTGRVYRLLGSPPTSSSTSPYLSHEELKRFLKLQPDLYTRDNLRRFERRMDEVKDLAREAVRPLMRNFLELDLSAFGGGGGLGYLTCTRLDGSELPWQE
ncbi:hypothetical protein MBLNU230_g3924t1 [Neophaeotheca triangularis]